MNEQLEVIDSALPLHDVTARKVHQWAMVGLVTAGLVIAGLAGGLLLALAGAVMLVGRFWWPADLFRQLTWRVLEPAGVLPRREVHEDHATRRVARVLGGAIWLLAGVLLPAHLVAAWALAVPIALMVALDAVSDFCVLCFLVTVIRR
ncbi:MAG: DUF4395 family protein [Candidatus Dormibacteraeota bacterium]|nr:DUF4395 family protein [Candidatus Dormibacteraeota bacterium]